MGKKTASDLSSVLSTDKKLVSQMVSVVYDKTNSLIGRIIPMRGYKAGTQVTIKLNSAANSSAEVYTEGQSMPAVGQQTVITANFSFKHFRILIGETLHARRTRGPQGQGLLDGVPAEFELLGAVRDLRNLMTTTFTADAQIYSIDGIIDDDTTNFGDLDRSTYTSLKSYVKDASGAAVSTSLLNETKFMAQKSPYNADVELWLAEGNLLADIAELQSGKGAFPNINTSTTPSSVYAAGREIVHLPGMATDTILGMTDVDGSWGYTTNEQGNMAIDGSTLYYHALGPTDSSTSASIETAGTIWCTQPQRQVRLKGLSV